MQERHLIITGGAGFIGSCLAKRLNELGKENLVIVDALGTDDKWQNLVGKRFAQIVHPDHLFTWLDGREDDIEGFFHLGACSSTVEQDADYLLENNTHYSQKLATYALEHGHRFVYASSAATYGDGSLGFSDSHASLEALRPLNMYGYSKHLFDLWLLRQGFLDRVVGLKYFNIFGPNEFHKGRMASAVLKMVPQVQQDGHVSLFKSSDPQYANGEQVRDFLYVKDAVDMTIACLEPQFGGIYNIGMGVPHTWKALAAGVFKGLGCPEKIAFIDMPPDLIGKYQNYTCAEMTKGWADGLPKPAYTLESAVVDYVQNHVVKGERW